MMTQGKAENCRIKATQFALDYLVWENSMESNDPPLKLGKRGDVSREDLEKFIAFWESADYTKEGNQYFKECPEQYRDEFVAWLREEYL